MVMPLFKKHKESLVCGMLWYVVKRVSGGEGGFRTVLQLIDYMMII